MAKGRPVGDMMIRMSYDGSKFEKGLKSINNQVKLAKQEMKTSLSVMSKNATEVQVLGKNMNGLSNVMKANATKIKELQKRHKEASRVFGENSKEAKNFALQINRTVEAQAKYANQMNDLKRKMVYAKNDTKQLSQNYKELKDNNKILLDQMKATGKTYSTQKMEVRLLKDEMKQYGKIVDTQKVKIRELTKTFGVESQEVKRAKEELKKYNNEAKNIAIQHSQLQANLSKTSPKLGEAQDKMGAMNKRVTDFGVKIGESGKKYSEFGNNLISSTAIMSAGVIMGFKKMLDTAANFEQGIKDIEALMSPDDWAKNGKKIEAMVHSLGESTKFTATEVASGTQELIKAGVTTTDILDGALESALSLSVAGGVELPKAAELMSTALNAFKDDTMTAKEASDIMTGAAIRSATTVEEMGYAMKMVSAVAAPMGFSFEDVNTALATFANAGLKGSDGGTSLKTMLMRLSPQTDQAAAVMSDLGIATTNTTAGYKYLTEKGLKPTGRTVLELDKLYAKLAKQELGAGASKSKLRKETDRLKSASGYLSSAFFDEKGNVKEMSDVFDILHTSTKNLSAEQKTNAFNTMFGSDAIRGAMIASKAGAKAFDEMNESLMKVDAKDVAAQKMDTLKGTLEELRGQTETFVTKIGTFLIPTMKSLIEVMKSIVGWMSNTSDSTKKIIGLAIGIPAIMLPIGLAVGLLSKGFGGLFSIVSGGVKLFGFMIKGGQKLSTIFKSNNATTEIGGRKLLRYNTIAGKNIKIINSQTNALRLQEIQARRTFSAMNSIPSSSATVIGKGKKPTNKTGSTKIPTPTPTPTPSPKPSKVGGIGKVGAKALPVVGGVATIGMGVYAMASSSDKKQAEAAGSTIGSVAGATIGGTIGSFAGPLGTAFGAVVGGTIGDKVGGKFGEKAKDFFNTLDKKNSEHRKALEERQKREKDQQKLKAESKSRIESNTAYEFRFNSKDLDISKKQADQLDTIFNEMFAKTNDQMFKIYDSGVKISSKTGQKLLSQQYDMSSKVMSVIKREHNARVNALGDVLKRQLESGQITQKQYDDQLSKLKQKLENEYNQTKINQDRIQDILSKAFDERRSLTRDEVAEITSLQKKGLDATVKAMNVSREKQKEIQEKAKKDEQIYTEEQALRRKVKIAKELQENKDLAKKKYEEEIKSINELADLDDESKFEARQLAKADYEKKIQDLDGHHNKQKTRIMLHTQNLIKLNKDEIKAMEQGPAQAQKFLLDNMKAFNSEREREALRSKLEMTDISEKEANALIDEAENVRINLAKEARLAKTETERENKRKQLINTGLSKLEADLMIKYGRASTIQIVDYARQAKTKTAKEYALKKIKNSDLNKKEKEMLTSYAQSGSKGIVKWVSQAKTETEKENRRKMVKNSELSKTEKKKVLDNAEVQKKGVVKKAREAKEGSIKQNESLISRILGLNEKNKPSLFRSFANLFKTSEKAAEESSKNTGNVLSTVAGWFGEKWSAAGKANKGKKPKKHATGTNSHSGGLAMVNDAKSKNNYKELVTLPNGHSFVPEGRNVVMDLPKGSKVMKGTDTTKLSDAGMIPQYKNGIGWMSGIASKISSWKNKFDDYLSDPKGTVKKLVGDTIPVIGAEGTHQNAVTTGLKKKNESWLENWLSEKDSMSGDFSGDSSITNKFEVYDYLYGIAKKIMSSKLGKGLVITSGHRKGHKYDHGRHNAIDLSGFGKNGGYKNVAKWASRIPGVSYTIGDNTVFGKKYGDGGRPSWATGHMNHLHVSGSGAVAGSKGDKKSSSGVSKYRSIATKALKMSGEYSEGNLNALMMQMQSESGGNPRAINNWDINALRGTPSKGLMQVIDPTFRAYAHKGYNKNIYDPMSNILAAINYTKKRYGSLQRGWKGKGYANGGLVKKHQIAQIAEGNNPEMVIPFANAKRGRAVQLLHQTAKHFGYGITDKNTGGGEVSLDNNQKQPSNIGGNNILSQVLNVTIEQNNILRGILSKDTSVYVDGKEIATTTEKYNNRKQNITNFAKGL